MCFHHVPRGSSGCEICSKKFALVIQDGKASYLAIEEKLEDWKLTSAEAIIDLFTPNPVEARKTEKLLIAKSNEAGIVATIGAIMMAVVVALSSPISESVA